MEAIVNKKIETVQEVLDFLNSIDSINHGGCGLAAYAIYLWFLKNNNLPDDFAIVYLHGGMNIFDWGDEDFKTNKDFLEGNNDDVTSCSHAVVHVNGEDYDSRGVFTGTADYRLSIAPNKIDKFMKASLKKVNYWNSRFERKVQLPIIESQLGIKFNLE